MPVFSSGFQHDPDHDGLRGQKKKQQLQAAVESGVDDDATTVLEFIRQGSESICAVWFGCAIEQLLGLRQCAVDFSR